MNKTEAKNVLSGLLDAFDRDEHGDYFYEHGWEVCEAVILAMQAVDTAPVVHGKWEKVIPTKSAAKWSTQVSCSICHMKGYSRHKFCPNCGAKMDGGKSDV